MGTSKCCCLSFILLWAALSTAQEEIPECLGDSEFIVVNVHVNFDQATEACNATGGTLAVPFNSAEQDLIAALLNTFGRNTGVFLGTQCCESKY